MAKRKRRSFTKEFKTQAVRIVRESGKAVGTVARELDLTETALRSAWGAGRGPGGYVTRESRESARPEARRGPRSRCHQSPCA